jgi:hypothetical protein
MTTPVLNLICPKALLEGAASDATAGPAAPRVGLQGAESQVA